MLKKKSGFKPKPKGAPVRRNGPGPSQANEERESQPTIGTPISQTSPVEDSSSQTMPTNQPTAAPQIPPTPPPTASTPTPTPMDSEATPLAQHTAAVVNDVHEDSRAKQIGATGDALHDEPVPNVGADTEKESAPPTSAETVIAPADAETPGAPPTESPRRTTRKPNPVRSRLPSGRPATVTRGHGAVTPSPSGPSATPEPTAGQVAIPNEQAASAIPSHVQTIQTATPPDEPAAEPQPDQPQPSVEAAADLETDEPPTAPAKAKRAPRKRKSVADAAETNGDAAPAPKRTRKKAAAAPAVTPAESDEAEARENGESGESSQTPASPKRTRVPIVRRAASEAQSGGEGSDAGVSDTQPRRRGGFRQRSVTPEDAEQQQVDMRQVKMGDLVKDLKIGKKFSRHHELLERERQKKLKAKMRAAGQDPENPDDDANEGVSASGTPTPGSSSSIVKKPSEPTSSGGGGMVAAAPQFQIIDGQIVVNQATLQFDRHAAAADAAGYMEEEEEDEFTHLTTQNSYRKKIQKPNHWNALDTEQFYEALRMFGTDFETIAKMFPGKNRRHLKLKFNREERANPARINAVLVGERPGIDLERFQSKAGLQLRPTQEILDEDTARREAFEEEQERAEAEVVAEETRKREALFSKGVKEGEEEVLVKGRGRGKKKRMAAGGIGI